jgi:hypothetical protein
VESTLQKDNCKVACFPVVMGNTHVDACFRIDIVEQLKLNYRRQVAAL